MPGGAESMMDSQNVVLSVDFDGITEWHVSNNEDVNSYSYSIDV